MIDIDLRTSVGKPIEDVFAYIGNLHNMPEWNTTVVEVEQTTPGDVGVGTKFKSVGKMLGRRVEGEMRVTAYEPDTKIGVQMNAGPVLIDMSIVLRPEAIYVLHAFQKKSKRGIATPRRDLDVIRARLKRAGEEADHAKERDS